VGFVRLKTISFALQMLHAEIAVHEEEIARLRAELDAARADATVCSSFSTNILFFSGLADGGVVLHSARSQR
jgi:hypothetical protein